LSYQVIARRWRSQTFEELVGQNHVTQTLTNALKNNRLPHALLFTGPRGTGKTSTARILAKALRCPNSKDFVPCNKCQSCLEIAAGNSPDVREMDAASNNGVDDIRELISGVMHMPTSGKHKIYIIDEVHMLSTAAFNALLKTLEEPPAHVIFMLATTEVQKIPETILSRCQRFDFRRIQTRVITDRLKLICDTDKIAYDEDALWLIARQGDGSMRDSLSLLDQVISFTNGQLTKALVTDVLGLSDRNLLFKSLSSIVGRDPQGVLTSLENISKSGFEPKNLAQDLLETIRNLLIIKISGSEMTDILELPDSELKALAELSANVTQEDLHFLFDMALKGAADIARAQDPRLVLEMLFLRMASAPQIVDLRTIVGQAAVPGRPIQMQTSRPPTEALKKKFDIPVNPTPTKSTATDNPTLDLQSKSKVHKGEENNGGTTNSDRPREPVQKKVKPTEPKEKWLDFVEQIRSEEALFAAKIENLIFSKIENNVIYVGVPPKLVFLREQMKDAETRKKLKSFIDAYWGPGHSLEVLVGKESVKGDSAHDMAQKKKDMKEDEIKNLTAAHPKVKAAQSVFKGKIKSVSALKAADKKE
jgi:DNA polymerase-3 subunit gamma/tau